MNPANGAELAGKSGLLQCRDPATGRPQREQTLREGRFVGPERFFDREGRLLRERTVNERGNSEGRTAEFWPDGRLRREEHAVNGRPQGPARSFDSQGRLERLAFHGDGRELFSVSYNPAGQPTRLACPERSAMPEDRSLCGFGPAGAADTLLYFQDGGKAAQRRYENGRLMASSEWNADGAQTSEWLFEHGRRVFRRYSADGPSGAARLPAPVRREERIHEPDARPLTDRGGQLAVQRRWSANGQLIEQTRYAAGRETLEERWYANGERRERTVLTGVGAAAHLQGEFFRDDGRLTHRSLFTADRLPTGVQQRFHANGQLASEETYSAPDSRGRTRLEVRRQWAEDGELMADDVLLEDGSRQRKPGLPSAP
ncbi:hypothetical protein M4R22_07325 [Acidovorax sp. GBBC 3334]|uniref:toxin-antitoxin system YwqK family antitoxin n=1 Tax=Acidovorax sp. GBBC 3334 TaxID=2940496 RepID=UPI002302F984|nr:hypothetical protein [Acidovorax sp. GBBC 3334]MDA8454568.1 hypothetical protein [Acidovorax sp. GBBC 3334]